MEGNVAYINNGFANQKVAQPRPAVKKQNHVRPAAAAKKQAKRARAGLISTIFIILVAFGAMSLLVSRYAAVCSIGSANNSIEQSIKEMETQIEALRINIELKDDLQYVQNTAQNDLGMTYPTQDQIINIDING